MFLDKCGQIYENKKLNPKIDIESMITNIHIILHCYFIRTQFYLLFHRHFPRLLVFAETKFFLILFQTSIHTNDATIISCISTKDIFHRWDICNEWEVCVMIDHVSCLRCHLHYAFSPIQLHNAIGIFSVNLFSLFLYTISSKQCILTSFH